MKNLKIFITPMMAEICLKPASREDVEIQDALPPTGELGSYEGVSFISSYDPEPCQAGVDMVDSRLYSKCKSIRRRARGW